MKKTLSVLLLIIIILAMTSCGNPAATATSDPSATTTPVASSAAVPTPVNFSDPVLESLIRASIGKPDGDITPADVEAVTRLNLSWEWQSDPLDYVTIKELGGLEAFTGLEYLDLTGHEIADLAPLSGLSNLTVLILSGNPVTDLAPLRALAGLRRLDLSNCDADDYTPLAGLTSLEHLNLSYSLIEDVTPLSTLTNLKYLFLEGAPTQDYSPLSDLYPNFLGKDFFIASTLAELGFYMDDNSKLAILDGEGASVRLNHREWGNPPDDWTGNCIRIVTEQNGYKIDIGYYPEHDAYVTMAFKNEMVLNYVYNMSGDSQLFDPADRANLEEIVRTIFPDATDEDILMAPVRIHQELFAQTVGLSMEALYRMPFDANDKSLPTAFTRLGFTFLDYKGTYFYQEMEPHERNIYIHRSDFDAAVPPENRLDWNIQFYDEDVNGYTLQMFYYEADDRYLATLDKNGVQASVNILPATGQPGDASPDLETAREIFNDAFGTEGDDYNEAALRYYEQFLQDRFGMGAEEFYGTKE